MSFFYHFSLIRLFNDKKNTKVFEYISIDLEKKSRKEKGTF